MSESNPYAWWCRECDAYVEATSRRRQFGQWCPNGCGDSCVHVPDAKHWGGYDGGTGSYGLPANVAMWLMQAIR